MQFDLDGIQLVQQNTCEQYDTMSISDGNQKIVAPFSMTKAFNVPLLCNSVISNTEESSPLKASWRRE